MVTGRNTTPIKDRGTVDRLPSGQRLKRAIHVARARLGLTSDVQVSSQAGVSYDTLMNWYSGRTTPRPYELRKVAVALQVAYSELWAIYEGLDPEPLPLTEAVQGLTERLEDLIAELRLTRAEQIVATETMMEALGALGSTPSRARRRDDSAREGRAATPRR